MAIAHTTMAMCFVTVIVQSRLVDFDLSLEEAAMDLGAPPLRTFLTVTLPLILPAVAERLTRLAKLVGRENVIGGTDCGFAQSPYVRRVHPSIMWAKLEALAEGARLASQELWGRKAA